jgi:hypothetical protein
MKKLLQSRFKCKPKVEINRKELPLLTVSKLLDPDPYIIYISGS